jgi:hypothetical protein
MSRNLGVAVLMVLSLAPLTGRPVARAAHRGGKEQVFVYWDQNEEEDTLIGGQVKQLVLPWDANGQMCIFPDRSGRFTTGYNPTLPSQDNPGGACPGGGGACLKPLHNPPVGEAIWDRHGNSTPDATISVPGPYALPGSTIGGDIPPQGGGSWQSGAYNNDGSYTGCVFDRQGDFFAVDLGTAQGQIPSPSNGRLIEWFAPDYTSYCILYGPTTGGVGPHHVDGSGGLQNPGTLAVRHGDVYVPETGAGRVLRFLHESFPRTVAQCGADGLASPPAEFEVFIKDPNLLFPGGIAHDPTSGGWAVTNVASNIIHQQAIAWYDATGKPDPTRRSVPAGNYSPFGLAFAPGGDLYFVDIHVTCDASGCGPGNNNAGILKVTLDHGVPSPPQLVAGGLNFPVSVTVCDTTRQTCPTPP